MCSPVVNLRRWIAPLYQPKAFLSIQNIDVEMSIDISYEKAVYTTFSARDKSSDALVEYRVQDLPESRFSEALNMYVKHFLPDEPMCSSKNIHKRPGSVAAFCDFWTECFSLRVSLGCFKGDELVGVNCLVVSSKNDSHDKKDHEDEALKDVFDGLGYTFDQADIFGRYGVERYLAAYGLVVAAEYRGRNIATEIIKARVPLMRQIGVSATATAFSVIGSQKAAKNAGFEDVYVISYEDFKMVDPRFDFSKTQARVYKIMAMKI